MRDHVDTSASSARRASRSPRVRRAIRLLVVGVAIVALGFAAVGPIVGAAVGTGASSATEPGLVVSDAAVDPDATESHRVALTDAPDGLAGFELTLELEDDGVATVAGADYPDHFGMTTDPEVSADGGAITVEAVDLNDEVTPDATDVTLAEIDVTGAQAGETELRVTDLQVDADGGSAVDPSLEAGTLTVGDGGGSETDARSEPDDAETDADSGDDAVPGFAAGTAVAVIAALAVASLVRRT